MSYPAALRQHLRESFLDNFWLHHPDFPMSGSPRSLNALYGLRSLLSLKAFASFHAISGNSGGRDAPYEYAEISRQEITFFDGDGLEVGSCLPEQSFTVSWRVNANHKKKGEMVEEALARLGADADSIAFVLVVFYSHKKIKSVTVWKV